MMTHLILSREIHLSNIDFVLESSSLGLNEIIVSASRKKEKITEAPSVVQL